MRKHPSGEDIAAYLSRGLSETDCGKVESHLADCRECRNEVTSARRLLSSHRPRTVWLWVGPAAAAAAIAVVMLTPWLRTPDNEALRADPERASSAVEIQVVTPQKGEVISSQPAFVWRSLPGRPLYRITVSAADGTEVWTAETSDTSIVVPPGVVLENARSYLWLRDALETDGQSVTSGTRQFRLAR
jgi:hypothetical protein